MKIVSLVLVLVLGLAVGTSCERTTGPRPNLEKARGQCGLGTCQGRP